jgi:serine/threonine protein kinase/tetratricopeptide (TPR) repeat protein
MMRLSPGTRLGTYQILSALGAGGMGEVYRARDTRLGRDVAVKVLPEVVASSPDRLARFEREARTVAGLNHPNIVTLFSVDDEDGIRFLTMELIEGQSLTSLVMPGGLPLSRILDLSIPLTDALAAAHERGVIHRDLKPGNVMMTRDGRLKILDFGLAKVAASEETTQDATFSGTAEAAISSEGHIMGTVPYMAPEQVRGETVDARSDLFALGIMLYELSTGRRPFTGATAEDVAFSIVRDTPEPIGRLRKDLPGDLEQIVGRCMSKDPRERYQTALEVCHELRRVKDVLEHGARPSPASQEIPSIAVLPFVNRSTRADEEYFSEGLADELLNMLAKIRGLRVAARTSSFTFKGKEVTIAEVGRALNVATVLEGSVRKAGNRVRISVQLVKVAGGYHLWSETYDRTLEDIFAVQDDIAHAVVNELRTTLLGEEADERVSREVKAEVARAARGRGRDPEAHRLYLQARHLIDRYTREDTAKGIEYLKQALARNPEFALAWAELGGAYFNEAGRGWAPATEGLGRAREFVERALALEPDLAEAHAIQGWIRMAHDWDWRGAEASIRRAMELAPGNAEVLRGAGVLARTQGRIDEAIELYRRALEQDPLSASSYSNLGMALDGARRFAEAEGAYRKALDLNPQVVSARALLSLTLLARGRGVEALAEAIREPEEYHRLWALGIIHHVLGHRTESDEAVRDLIDKYADHWPVRSRRCMRCGGRGTRPSSGWSGRTPSGTVGSQR